MKELQVIVSEESVKSIVLALLYVSMGVPEEMGNVFLEQDLIGDPDGLISGIAIKTFDDREWVLRLEPL